MGVHAMLCKLLVYGSSCPLHNPHVELNASMFEGLCRGEQPNIWFTQACPVMPLNRIGTMRLAGQPWEMQLIQAQLR